MASELDSDPAYQALRMSFGLVSDDELEAVTELLTGAGFGEVRGKWIRLRRFDPGPCAGEIEATRMSAADELERVAKLVRADAQRVDG